MAGRPRPKRANPARRRRVQAGLVAVPVRRVPGAEDIPLPQYMSAGASGMDIHAAVPRRLVLKPGEIRLVPTGLAVAVPGGHEGQVRARSGLSLRHGVLVLNAPGTIDSDYRGEIGVILANLGRRPFVIERGDRIAQLVVARVSRVAWVEREALARTRRESGGFGHTGGRGGAGRRTARKHA